MSDLISRAEAIKMITSLDENVVALANTEVTTKLMVMCA